MDAKLCLPILKKSKHEVLKEIERNKKNFDVFEVWISRILNVDEDFIKNLVKKLDEKLILVFRDLNGNVTIPNDKRHSIIALCNESKTFVDIDINKQKNDLLFIRLRKLKIRTIVSYHNYKETPQNLHEIAKSLQKENPTIIKISTKCENKIDALRLLALLLFFKKVNKKCIVLGMGKESLITRIFGPLWGNEFTFAPVNKTERSASGQLTLEQLRSIFDIVYK